MQVGHAVGAAEALGKGARLDQSVGADIGTEVDKDLAPHSEDRAVAAAGDLNLAIRLTCVVHRGQVLAPVFEPADRASDMPRRKRDQKVLGIELPAGAKATADIVFDQIDTRWGKPEHRSQGIAIKERYLGSAEHSHPLLRTIPLGEKAARFHRQRGVALHLEALAPHIGSVTKGGFSIAEHSGKRHGEIGAALLEQ